MSFRGARRQFCYYKLNQQPARINLLICLSAGEQIRAFPKTKNRCETYFYSADKQVYFDFKESADSSFPVFVFASWWLNVFLVINLSRSCFMSVTVSSWRTPHRDEQISSSPTAEFFILAIKSVTPFTLSGSNISKGGSLLFIKNWGKAHQCD